MVDLLTLTYCPVQTSSGTFLRSFLSIWRCVLNACCSIPPIEQWWERASHLITERSERILGGAPCFSLPGINSSGRTVNPRGCIFSGNCILVSSYLCIFFIVVCLLAHPPSHRHCPDSEQHSCTTESHWAFWSYFMGGLRNVACCLVVAHCCLLHAACALLLAWWPAHPPTTGGSYTLLRNHWPDCLTHPAFNPTRG